MTEIRPFRGLRPRSDAAEQVIAPPYDVISEDEARAIFASRPRAFVCVTRPEVNLPRGLDGHGPEAYAAARLALETLIAEGTLVQDEQDSFYLYEQRMGEHHQRALMALCRTRDYDSGAIRRHEHTRPDKEQDRVEHISATDAQTGLVFLTYRESEATAAALRGLTDEHLFTVTTDDGVRHSLSRVQEPSQLAALRQAFGALPALYIADGHHRSAAASRVAAQRGQKGEAAWFLAGLFPQSSLHCMAYNRLVSDLAGFSPEAFRARLEQDFTVEAAEAPLPPERGTLTMFLEDRWWLLRPLAVDRSDPVALLDVAVLQDRVLSPLLGIEDPRTDDRISFVGGVRGPGALEAEVRAGRAAVAFHMYPTGLDQLFAVADAGRVMPPKSTWFEPKLAGGVLIHLL